MMRIQEKAQISHRIQCQKRIINLSNEQPEIRQELLAQFRLFDKVKDSIKFKKVSFFIKRTMMGLFYLRK